MSLKILERYAWRENTSKIGTKTVCGEKEIRLPGSLKSAGGSQKGMEFKNEFRIPQIKSGQTLSLFPFVIIIIFPR
jgi:DUF917 family protein